MSLVWESPAKKRKAPVVDARTNTHHRINSVKASIYLASRTNYGAAVRPVRDSGMVYLRKPIIVLAPRASRQIDAMWAVKNARPIVSVNTVVNPARAWRQRG